MRLLNAHIQDFRCVDDSDEFSLDQVTCLVGKNESGKTAILKALYKLKPDTTNEIFEPQNDYPKRKWRPDAEINPDPPTIVTTWIFDQNEYNLLEKRFGVGTLKSKTFKISKGYEDKRIYNLEFEEQSLVKHLLSSANLSALERKPISGAKTVAKIRSGLESLANRTENQELLYRKLITEFKLSPVQTITDIVDDMVPTFLYFDQYLRLPGTVSVTELQKKKSENRLENSDRIFLALLGLAGATIETIYNATTFEAFNSSLRAVSNQISDQIFKYWTQNRHLDVEMHLDQARPNDLAPFNNGFVFRTRINNRRHRADTSFDDRSSGFVWFFSFLIWFYRLRETYSKNLIILLDEPGLSLHARAQGDLLRYINEQLRPDYQVIYTTHSPFMIDPDNLMSARTVEDVVIKDKNTQEEILLGTKVGEEILSTDPDTISPLQKALDYEITQTLFVGRHTLLVEGPSDLLYLQWFSQKLIESGKAGLDYRWSICQVGGVDRIPGFVSLFRGNHLNVVALVDTHSGQKQKIENAQKALEENHLILNNKYTENHEADIEDVLGREFYISLVNQVFDLSNDNKIHGITAGRSNRVIIDVENHFRSLPQYVREFSHFAPADALFQGKVDGTKLPSYDVALDRMNKMINDINSLI